ncbi:hypothetical protein ACFWDQ_14845 [Streptomyces sp. NPDC060053]|uniref:hypothetical protein n=1 Tax=Streptomyces sp. NPDC060053 TaxID=3347047 RepID=UPI0036C93904
MARPGPAPPSSRPRASSSRTKRSHTQGTVAGADREHDGADAGTWHVDVVGADGADRTVAASPDTGKAVGVHRDTDTDTDTDDDDDDDDDDSDDSDEAREDLAALKGASVYAREAAPAVAVKGAVTDVDLDDDDRAAVWGVDTATPGEWQADVRTGKVTRPLDD